MLELWQHYRLGAMNKLCEAAILNAGAWWQTPCLGKWLLYKDMQQCKQGNMCLPLCSSLQTAWMWPSYSLHVVSFGWLAKWLFLSGTSERWNDLPAWFHWLALIVLLCSIFLDFCASAMAEWLKSNVWWAFILKINWLLYTVPASDFLSALAQRWSWRLTFLHEQEVPSAKSQSINPRKEPRQTAFTLSYVLIYCLNLNTACVGCQSR